MHGGLRPATALDHGDLVAGHDLVSDHTDDDAVTGLCCQTVEGVEIDIGLGRLAATAQWILGQQGHDRGDIAAICLTKARCAHSTRCSATISRICAKGT